MTYNKPEVFQPGSAGIVIQGDPGKPFPLFRDFRPILLPAMAIGAYERDEEIAAIMRRPGAFSVVTPSKESQAGADEQRQRK